MHIEHSRRKRLQNSIDRTNISPQRATSCRINQTSSASSGVPPSTISSSEKGLGLRARESLPKEGRQWRTDGCELDRCGEGLARIIVKIRDQN